jgi:AcrR family transcriptional regulator
MPQDKKSLIYEAALSLINERYDISSIKIAEIAQRANIGKGTVYEYFDSKEQLIADALVYMTMEAAKCLEAAIENNCSFKESYFAIFNLIAELMNKNRTLFDPMSAGEQSFVMHKTLKSVARDKQDEIQQLYSDTFEKLIDKAVAEKIFKEKPPKFQWYIAVTNSIMCIIIYRQRRSEFSDMSEAQVLESSYEMFLKLLS